VLVLLLEGKAESTTRRLDRGSLSIGREECDWVLPDPSLELSREHCVIDARDDGFWITDKSRNGVYLNASSEPIGQGRSECLQAGDRLRLGPYRISVRITDPLSNEEPQCGADQPVMPPRTVDDAKGGRIFDPTWIESRATGPTQDSNESLRQMPEARPLSRGDHTPPHLEHLPQGNLRKEPGKSAQVSEGSAPRAQTDGSPGARQPSAGLYDETWIEGMRESPTTVVEGPGVMQPTPAPSPPLPREEHPRSTGQSSWQPEMTTRTQTSTSGQRARIAPASPVDDPGRGVVTSFLQGAGLAPEELSIEDPNEFMRLIGERVSILADGLRQLLLARDKAKAEAGLDQTQPQSDRNNPLKLSVGPQEATRAVLVQRGPGYLTPKDAIQVSLQDLAANELALMEGFEAAWSALLKRLEPEALERQSGQTSSLSRLLAGGRKASYWDAYRKHYGEIARRARQRFLGDFNFEFVEAYERKEREIRGKGS
jgi:type VI secretion system FHA domain protein